MEEDIGMGRGRQRRNRNQRTEHFFRVCSDKLRVIFPNFKFKMFIPKSPIFLLHKNSEVGTNFTFFKAELLKLRVFGILFFEAELDFMKQNSIK
jgi:hypothetical protein